MATTSSAPNSSSTAAATGSGATRVVQGETRTTPNFEHVITQKKSYAKFKIIIPGFATKGNGTRIFVRVMRNGKWTWLSTHTDDLELAKLWKQKYDRKAWLLKEGFVEKEAAVEDQATRQKPENNQNGKTQNTKPNNSSSLTVDDILDNYVGAGHPTVRKRRLKPKAPRSIKNETDCLRPLREYFRSKLASGTTLGDCDEYRAWRNGGGYLAKFMLRGHAVEKKTKGGDRSVDLELIVLSNAFELAVRQGKLETNPIRDRGRYADEANIRHCREVAPTPKGLALIVAWLISKGFPQDANLTNYLAFTGERLGEALSSRWAQVQWADEIINVKRLKRGVFPFVLLLPELAALLRRMKRKAKSDLLFPSPFNPATPRDASSFRRRLAQAARACGLSHVTPQGLRSYFVTQARQSGLTDAEIAQLIGDKTGPSLISEVYGDVRPDHLLAVARNIKLTARTRQIRNPVVPRKSRRKASRRNRR